MTRLLAVVLALTSPCVYAALAGTVLVAGIVGLPGRIVREWRG